MPLITPGGRQSTVSGVAVVINIPPDTRTYFMMDEGDLFAKCGVPFLAFARREESGKIFVGQFSVYPIFIDALKFDTNAWEVTSGQVLSLITGLKHLV